VRGLSRKEGAIRKRKKLSGGEKIFKEEKKRQHAAREGYKPAARGKRREGQGKRISNDEGGKTSSESGGKPHLEELMKGESSSRTPATNCRHAPREKEGDQKEVLKGRKG